MQADETVTLDMPRLELTAREAVLRIDRLVPGGRDLDRDVVLVEVLDHGTAWLDELWLRYYHLGL